MQTIRSVTLPIIPASRSTRPYGYCEPRRVTDRTLQTMSGLVIGGALAITDRRAPANDSLHLSPVVLSADAVRIQRALLDPRTAPRSNPTVFSRFYDVAVRPLISLC